MRLDVELLSAKFKESTGATQKVANRVTAHYIKLCAQQLLKHMNKDNEPFYAVSSADLFDALGSVQVKGKRIYSGAVFNAMAQRIISPVQTGNNLTGKLTLAEINYDLEDIILASGDAAELVTHLYAGCAESVENGAAVTSIEIDLKSLRNFIAANRAQHRRHVGDASKQKLVLTLDRNYKYARRIELIASVFEGFMPHVPSTSAFGRQYYIGPNLQNTPKVVRNAALGKCCAYDIESSVFAWKASLYKQIAEATRHSGCMPATWDYLEFKSAIRKRLANLLFGNAFDYSINTVKQAITAIGFGAPARVRGYMKGGKFEPTSLNSIIKSEALLQTFLDDAWVKAFIAEQKAMNEVIIAAYRPYAEKDDWTHVPELYTANKRLKPNSVISYLYQHAERQVLDYMVNAFAHREVLLTVHDCFYTRKPVKLGELRSGIKQFGEFFDVGYEAHTAYTYEDEGELLAHRARIAAEEYKSKDYQPKASFITRANAPAAPVMKRAATVLRDGNRCYYGAGNFEYDRDTDPFFEEEL